MDWVLIGAIIAAVAGIFAIVSDLFGGGRRVAIWFRERKSRKVEAQRQVKRAQRARRASAVRPKRQRRQSDGGWVFKGTGISPLRWLDRWR